MHRRGFLLITTILITLVVVMVVGAAIRLAPTALVSASHYSDTQQAMMALDIGLEYVRNRLKEDMSWSGSPNSGPTTVVQTPDDSLVVVEDHGNVVGLVRFDSGQYGQFRIRFNHQDGPDGADGMDNPSADYELDLGVVSLNNLITGSPRALYATQSGALAQRNEFVQPFQAYLAVEGRAGPAFRDSDPLAPNRAPGKLRLTSRMAEVRMEATYSETLDAAAMAGGNIDAYLRRTLGAMDPTRPVEPIQLKIASAWSEGSKSPPRVRTKGALSVDSDSPEASQVNLSTEEGFLNTSSGTVSGTTRVNSTTTITTEQPSAEFYNLEWNEVHQSSSDPLSTDTVNLKAGTYVVEEAGNGEPQIRYFDMGLDEYLVAAQDSANPPPSVVLDEDLKQVRNNYSVTNSKAIQLHKTDHALNPKAPQALKAQLLIREDVYVQPTAQTSEFNFLPARGFVDGPPQSATEPHPGDISPFASYNTRSILFQFVPRDEGQAKFTCPGEVNINSQVYGFGGAIVSESDINMVGAGALSASEISDGGDGLSLYSKGDITINTYRPIGGQHTGGRYADMSLRGVVYAWGDVNFKLAPPPGDPVDPAFYNLNGYLRFRGSVVAYGGDPGDPVDNSPGSGTGGIGGNKGHIKISAHYAELRYDPKYLMSLDKLSTPGNFGFISYTLHQGSQL